MELQNMYALLCEVQQSSVEEEVQLKQARGEAHRLKEQNENTRVNLAHCQDAVHRSEQLLIRTLNKKHMIQSRHAALVEACTALRRAREEALAKDDAFLDEIVGGWQDISVYVSGQLRPPLPTPIMSPAPKRGDFQQQPSSSFTNQPAGPMVLLTGRTDNAHRDECDPSSSVRSSSKFTIVRGPTRKTMFQFR
jgi:hypothetical protein